MTDTKPSDLEIVKACAEAMGIPLKPFKDNEWGEWTLKWRGHYDPLHDKAQVFELVEKFHMSIGYSDGWGARIETACELLSGSFHYPDLPRAICLCVYRMHKGKL